MSNSKHLPKSIPRFSPYFELPETLGSITKEPYSGRFKSQVPNGRIQANIAKYVAFLNGGMDATLDQATKDLHKMHSYCKFTLLECPDWFRDSDWGYDLYDLNVLEAVYNGVLGNEERWLEAIWGKKEAAGEDSKA